MIGQDFGRYRIVDRLGEGGMGSVWKAEDTLLHRSVALKFLSAELADSAEARQRFLREARAASVLDHPGIATVYDAGEIDGAPYLAVQLIEGMTLSDRIGRGPLPVPEAVEIHRQASEALAHAHSRRVLHRDISSRNLMLKPDGSVVLVDFGLAKKSDMTQLTRTGTTQGTIAYLAPEVLEGSPATEASNRYSLGVVLYEMLTGDLPFQGERVEAVMLKIMTEEPEPPSSKRPDVTAEVDRTVLTLLKKDPGSRGGWDAAVQATRRATIGGDQPRNTSSPTPGRPSPPRPTRTGASRRGLLIGGGVLGLVLLTAGLLWLKPWQRSTSQTLPARTFQSIAVLPLENASQNPEESEPLARGIAQELATRLTGLAGLHVSPWVTSSRYIDLSDPSQVARELGVEALLTGTYRQQDLHIRVSLALIDARNGEQVWADAFEVDNADFFKVQRTLALKAAKQLLGEVSHKDQERLQTDPGKDLDAFALYLKGVDKLQAETRESNREAYDFIAQALARDPGLAEAHVGLGTALKNQFFYGWEGGNESLDQAAEHYLKALDLDPESISARRGLIRVLFEWGDTHGIRKLGLEAFRVDSTSIEGSVALAESFLHGLAPDKGIPVLERVLRQDSANVGAAFLRVVGLAFSAQYEKCVAAGAQFEQQFGPHAEVIFWTAFSHHCLGQLDKARLDYERYLDLFDNDSNLYIYLHAWSLYDEIGARDEARRCLEALDDKLRDLLAAHPDHLRGERFSAMAQAVRGQTEALDRLVRNINLGGKRSSLGGVDAELISATYWRIEEQEKCRAVLEQALQTPGQYILKYPLFRSTIGKGMEKDPNVADLLRRLQEKRELFEAEFDSP